MKNLFILLLDEYADWEMAYVASTINQNEDWTVTTISTNEEVLSIGGIRTKIDLLITGDLKTPDLLVLIGGNSWDAINPYLRSYIEKCFNENIHIAAICGAVDYLAKQGYLNKYKHTGNSIEMWNQYEKYSASDFFLYEQAVTDKNLVTANGTAPIDFIDHILKMIQFDGTESINKIIYMQRYGMYRYIDEYGDLPF